MDLALIWIHVCANLLWIGSIMAVGFIVSAPAPDPKQRGELATRIYMRLAVPGFVVSFLFGFARLLEDTHHYLKEHHWMHGKLLFVFIVIALHHVIGGRAKKMARGDVQTAGPAGILTILLGAAAAVAAYFVILQPM